MWWFCVSSKLWKRLVLLASFALVVLGVILVLEMGRSATGLAGVPPTPKAVHAPAPLAEPTPTPPPVKQVNLAVPPTPISDGFSSLQTTAIGNTALIGVQPQISVTVMSSPAPIVDRFNGYISFTITIANPNCTSIDFGNSFDAGGSSGSCGNAKAYFNDKVLFVTDAAGNRPARSSKTPLSSFTLAQNESKQITVQYLIGPNLALGFARLVYAPNGLGQHIGVFRLE